MIRVAPHFYLEGNGSVSTKISTRNEHRECITVVIPTLLMAPREVFEYTLNELNSNDLVKEIIIIDNTEDKSFDKVFNVSSKMNILKEPGNQGASCNIGMQLVKTEYYFITNDDVACRSSIINSCFDIMEQDKDIGLIQMNTRIRQQLDSYIESYVQKETEYIILQNPRATMTGWFQFGRKIDWVDISELRYFYGDDLILDIMRHNKRKVVRLVSDYVSHIESSTVSKRVPNAFLYSEEHVYKAIKKRLWNE